jgi:hypothetical protein
MSQAQRIAHDLVPSGRLTSVTLPDPSEQKSAYTVRFSEGIDPSQYDSHRGDVRVGVDQYSGRAAITQGDPSVHRPLSQVLWESWDFPIHTGTAVTGMTTWLMRRRKRRARAALPAA